MKVKWGVRSSLVAREISLKVRPGSFVVKISKTGQNLENWNLILIETFSKIVANLLVQCRLLLEIELKTTKHGTRDFPAGA